jgi:hypothetical protein
MTTKLDDLVGYLAGREGGPRFQNELEDPASDVNLFLEAARTRSKALIQEPTVPDPRGKVRTIRNWPRSIARGCAAVAGLAAIALAVWFFETRLSRIEAEQKRAAAEARASSDRLEASLDRLRDFQPDPVPSEIETKTFARIEAGLGQLEARLERAPASSSSDPSFSQLREEVAGLRREMTASEKARIRQGEELQSLIHEVGRVQKLILNRVEPLPPPASPESPRTFPPSRSQ